MLTVSHRFHGHGSLRYVYKHGAALRSHLITIKYSPNPHRKNSRVAVVISKKVLKSAVGRNRIRRRIYEIIRHELPNFSRSFDLAIMVFSSEVLSLPHKELQEIIIQLLTSAEIYKKS